MQYLDVSRENQATVTYDPALDVVEVTILVDDPEGEYVLYLRDSGANLLRPDQPATNMNMYTEYVSFSSIYVGNQTLFRVIARTGPASVDGAFPCKPNWLPHLNVVKFIDGKYRDCDFVLRLKLIKISSQSEQALRYRPHFKVAKIE